MHMAFSVEINWPAGDRSFDSIRLCIAILYVGRNLSMQNLQNLNAIAMQPDVSVDLAGSTRFSTRSAPGRACSSGKIGLTAS